MYYIRQKNDILVVAMQKISLATIFIRELNDFILISDFEYEPNRTLLSYEKITIRFCCFCSTATVTKAKKRGEFQKEVGAKWEIDEAENQKVAQT